MFLQEFFDVMGLPIQQPVDEWLNDPVTRLQNRADQLAKAFKQGCHALVRRRRRIEVLRQQIERAAEGARWHHESISRLLRREESAYQDLLARVARCQRKLRRVQSRICRRQDVGK